jgi:hypothetical protein
MKPSHQNIQADSLQKDKFNLGTDQENKWANTVKKNMKGMLLKRLFS